uniref:Uncharacterized protein n=1 Tax=Chrysotila carterae TaxID=13221 RepID=A0A7S4C388_CHRCT|mmetsp:Transcript_53007/g.115671  ORF Transcript_53007/g.115671 Transcript_53007/m.115671 type:complete len:454 (+) Transcript_53007:358-1719(+)
MTLPPSRAAQNEADNSNNLTSDAVDKLSNLAHVAQAGVPAQPVSIPTARSEAVSGVTEGSITSSAARTMAEDVTRQVQLDELIDSKLQCLLSANPDVQRRAIRVLDQISASDLERHLPRITHDLLHHAGARREALRLLLRMRPSRLVDHATLLISLLDANDATVRLEALRVCQLFRVDVILQHLPQLISLLQQGKKEVSTSALVLLTPDVGGESLLPALRAFEDGEEPQLRRAARHLVGLIDKKIESQKREAERRRVEEEKLPTPRRRRSMSLSVRGRNNFSGESALEVDAEASGRADSPLDSARKSFSELSLFNMSRSSSPDRNRRTTSEPSPASQSNSTRRKSSVRLSWRRSIPNGSPARSPAALNPPAVSRRSSIDSYSITSQDPSPLIQHGDERQAAATTPRGRKKRGKVKWLHHGASDEIGRDTAEADAVDRSMPEMDSPPKRLSATV